VLGVAERQGPLPGSIVVVDRADGTLRNYHCRICDLWQFGRAGASELKRNSESPLASDTPTH